MKQTTQVEEPLFCAAHPQLEKQISVKQILLSSCIALFGVMGIVLSLVMDKSESTLCMTFLTIGILLMLFALYRFFTKSKEMIYKPTGSEVRSDSLYMDSVELQSLKQMMVKNEFSTSSRLVFKEGGNGRLDYMVSKDGRFLAMELFQFVPYTYEPVTGVYYYADDEAVAVARYINL